MKFKPPLICASLAVDTDAVAILFIVSQASIEKFPR